MTSKIRKGEENLRTKVCTRCESEKPVAEFAKLHLGNGEFRWRSCCRRCLKIEGICRKFNITVDEYHSLFDNHDGCCDICRLKCPTGKRLAIDHDHETGSIRGLLCINCNKGLGHFKDDVRLLRRAIDYLES